LGLWKTAATAELLETVEGREENPSFHYETRALQIVDSSEGIASCTYNILDQGAHAVLVSTALNISLRWSFVWQIFVGIESFGNTEMELKFSSLQ
jgi:hypothetical protein